MLWDNRIGTRVHSVGVSTRLNASMSYSALQHALQKLQGAWFPARNQSWER